MGTSQRVYSESHSTGSEFAHIRIVPAAIGMARGVRGAATASTNATEPPPTHPAAWNTKKSTESKTSFASKVKESTIQQQGAAIKSTPSSLASANPISLLDYTRNSKIKRSPSEILKAPTETSSAGDLQESTPSSLTTSRSMVFRRAGKVEESRTAMGDVQKNLNPTCGEEAETLLLKNCTPPQSFSTEVTGAFESDKIPSSESTEAKMSDSYTTQAGYMGPTPATSIPVAGEFNGSTANDPPLPTMPAVFYPTPQHVANRHDLLIEANLREQEQQERQAYPPVGPTGRRGGISLDSNYGFERNPTELDSPVERTESYEPTAAAYNPSYVPLNFDLGMNLPPAFQRRNSNIWNDLPTDYDEEPGDRRIWISSQRDNPLHRIEEMVLCSKDSTAFGRAMTKDDHDIFLHNTDGGPMQSLGAHSVCSPSESQMKEASRRFWTHIPEDWRNKASRFFDRQGRSVMDVPNVVHEGPIAEESNSEERKDFCRLPMPKEIPMGKLIEGAFRRVSEYKQCSKLNCVGDKCLQSWAPRSGGFQDIGNDEIDLQRAHAANGYPGEGFKGRIGLSLSEMREAEIQRRMNIEGGSRSVYEAQTADMVHQSILDDAEIKAVRQTPQESQLEIFMGDYKKMKAFIKNNLARDSKDTQNSQRKFPVGMGLLADPARSGVTSARAGVYQNKASVDPVQTPIPGNIPFFTAARRSRHADNRTRMDNPYTTRPQTYTNKALVGGTYCSPSANTLHAGVAVIPSGPPSQVRLGQAPPSQNPAPKKELSPPDIFKQRAAGHGVTVRSKESFEFTPSKRSQHVFRAPAGIAPKKDDAQSKSPSPPFDFAKRCVTTGIALGDQKKDTSRLPLAPRTFEPSASAADEYNSTIWGVAGLNTDSSKDPSPRNGLGNTQTYTHYAVYGGPGVNVDPYTKATSGRISNFLSSPMEAHSQPTESAYDRMPNFLSSPPTDPQPQVQTTAQQMAASSYYYSSKEQENSVPVYDNASYSPYVRYEYS